MFGLPSVFVKLLAANSDAFCSKFHSESLPGGTKWFSEGLTLQLQATLDAGCAPRTRLQSSCAEERPPKSPKKTPRSPKTSGRASPWGDRWAVHGAGRWNDGGWRRRGVLWLDAIDVGLLHVVLSYCKHYHHNDLPCTLSYNSHRVCVAVRLQAVL